MRYLASLFQRGSHHYTHTSTGRGNPHSFLCRRVSANRLSIMDRLTARSVTGQGLQILVHQHYGYRLLLEWRGSCSRVSSRFMERRFLMACEAERFYTELCSYGLEGLCTCVYEGYYMSTHVRAPRCLRKPLMQSQKYLLKPTWWLKALQHVKRNSLWVSYFLFLYARMEEYIRHVCTCHYMLCSFMLSSFRLL
jgi:hypothetical protein